MACFRPYPGPDPWYDPTAPKYGAKFDGTTDDSTAIQAAINAASAAGGGEVRMPPGTAAIGTGLTWPSNVSITGTGSGSTILKALGAIDMLTSDSGASTVGTRYNELRGIYFNGNGLANRGINLGTCVERKVTEVRAENCKAGLVLRNTQNCRFSDVNLEHNNIDNAAGHFGAGLRVSWGAFNNVFERVELNDNAPYNMVIHASAAIDPNVAAAHPINQPNFNRMYGCVFDPLGTGAVAQVLMRAGRSNTWAECNFSIGSGLTGFSVNNTDDTVALNALLDCYINGTDNTTTIFAIANHSKWRLMGLFLENAGTLFSIDDNSSVEIDGEGQYSSVTTFFTATGVKTRDQLIFGGEFRGYVQFYRSIDVGVDLANQVQLGGAAATLAPVIQAIGSDASVSLSIQPKAGGAVFLGNNVANYLQVQGQAAGTAPVLSAQGTDANLDVQLTAKGTGVLSISNAPTAPGGGANATLGTIGGTGPVNAAQNGWQKVRLGGNIFWVPVWQ